MAKRKLSNFDTAALRKELDRREGSIQKLLDARAKCASQLSDLDAEIKAMGGGSAAPAKKAPVASAAPKKGRGRPKGSKNKKGTAKAKTAGRGKSKKLTLVKAIGQVLDGTVLSVTDIADEVKKVGYKSKSATFRTIVNQTLLKHTDKFKKIARGQYTAK